MYVPEHFRSDDRAEAFTLIEAHPFATIIAVGEDGAPVVNHLPMLLDAREGAPAKIVGHMARGNPLWRMLAQRGEAFAVFHGPHAYVSPSWYEQHDVPTWNYAVAHVSGRVKLIEDARGLVRMLAMMTDRLERGVEKPWAFELPEDLRGAGELAAAIVGFEIEATTVTCKLKLGQNRSEADRQGAAKGLEARGDEMSRKIAEMMRRAGR